MFALIRLESLAGVHVNIADINSFRRGDFGRHIGWYPVKRPVGSTGKPSHGDIWESDPPAVALRNKGSCTGYGKFFINFTPGVSNKAAKAMRHTIRNWRIHLKPDKSIEDISRMFNPVIRGWVNAFHPAKTSRK